MANPIDYDIDDVVNNWDKKQRLFQSIEKSVNLSQLILLVGLIFIQQKKSKFTIMEISNMMGINKNYAYQLLSILVLHNMIARHEVQGKKEKLYILTDEKLLDEAIEKAKTNLDDKGNKNGKVEA